MGDIEFGLIGVEWRHMVSDGDSLVEGLHDGELHHPFKIGLTREDEDEGVVGIHFKVGQQAEFLQGACLQQMGLINDEQNGFSQLLFGLQKALLDLGVDGAFRQPLGKPEHAV